jgi:aminomethyltransferase
MSWRPAVLTDRHRALGSSLEDWGGILTAPTYADDIANQHEAIRTKAGLMDVSGLIKLDLAVALTITFDDPEEQKRTAIE